MNLTLKQRLGTIVKRNAAYRFNKITQKCGFAIINTKNCSRSVAESDLTGKIPEGPFCNMFSI